MKAENARTCDEAQWVKVSAAKSDNQNSMTLPHMVRGRTDPCKLYTDHMCAVTHLPTCYGSIENAARCLLPSSQREYVKKIEARTETLIC